MGIEWGYLSKLTHNKEVRPAHLRKVLDKEGRKILRLNVGHACVIKNQQGRCAMGKSEKERG